MELYLKTFKSLYNNYKYYFIYFNCSFCDFFKNTYYKYLISITFNYMIKTYYLHKLNPF